MSPQSPDPLPYIPPDLGRYEPGPQKPLFKWKLPDRWKPSDRTLLMWFIGLCFGLAFIFVVIVPPVLSAMTSDQVAIDAAEDLKYTDVTVIDKSTVWGLITETCKGSFDNTKFTVQATDQGGNRQQMVVCASFFGPETVVTSTIKAVP
jgi:hypothetical protein